MEPAEIPWIYLCQGARMVEVGECCGKVDVAVSLDEGRPFSDGFPRFEVADGSMSQTGIRATVAQLPA